MEGNGSLGNATLADNSSCKWVPVAHGGQECETTGEEFQVLFALLLILCAAGLLYCIHVVWRSREEEMEKASGVLNSASEYAKHLIEHFMPSMAVAKYQFRGIRPPKTTVNVAFHELGLTLHNGAKVLNGVTGEFKAGRMVAIMGPSGAGKTTFMNVLCGKATYGKMSGKVLINGRSTPIAEISSVLGFVPQDDIVHEELTVREQIRFAAGIRSKLGTTQERIERITDDVLNVMQIDHIQNSIVGGVEKRGISGGQRKRVNIGMELAAQPAILFLDEPTSGLDSTSSLTVIYSLKKMCELGMNCVMVIHQPRYSLFTLFDDVLLLGKGGFTVYLGNSGGAADYFSRLGFKMPDGENRADFFMDVISGEVPNPQIPNFVPKMLFESWEKHNKDQAQKDLENGEQQEDASRRGTGRNISEQEDLAALQRSLEEEWDVIDINRDGFLDADELQTLLTKACRLEPSRDVVTELITRMSDSGGDVVTKEQFLKYLLSLKCDIAMDASPEVQRPGGLVMDTLEQVTNLAHKLVDSNAAHEDDDEDEDSSDSSEDEVGTSRSRHMAKGLKRVTPGFCGQLGMLARRSLVAWWRENDSRFIFFMAMAVGATILALMDLVVNTPTWDAMSFVNTHTCIGLLITIYCLNTFGKGQPVFWRERNRGMRVFAYFLAKSSLNTVDLFMQCFLFTSVYYEIRQVHEPFFTYAVPYFMVAWAASGWGYAVSSWIPLEHGPFMASLIIFVVCGLLGNPMSLSQFLDNKMTEVGVSLISITRWSIPMSFLKQIEMTKPQYPSGSMLSIEISYFTDALSKGTWSHAFGYWWTGILALGIQGTVLRVVSLGGLMFLNRDKQV